MKPTILIVNDDLRLCEIRKLLLENCGAKVSTACGDPSDLLQKLRQPIDLVLIDSTNVGFTRGEQICDIVKAFDPGTCVAILATPELGIAERTLADRLILRTGPRRVLQQINELVGDRLDINFWERARGMEIKVLWFETEEKPSNVASTDMLQHDGVDLRLVHVRTTSELASVLEDDTFGCAVVVQEHHADTWREVLEILSALREHVPVVLLLQEDSEPLSREALLAGAWHAVSRHHEELCASAFQRSLQHAKATLECSRLHNALQSAEAILEKSQRSIALGILLGSIAHEINNPLEGLSNLLYLAKRAKADDTETLRACLDMSESELSRISEITKQMLSFHRDARSPEDISLAQLLDGVLTLFTAKLRQKRITVVRQYDSAGWMIARSGELRQAFVNLIANAVDAMDVDGRLTLRIRERGGSSPLLCVSIADSGKGMPRQLLNKLGELFLTTKENAGTGIGLWVTRRILHKHDGGLRVYSSQTPGRSGTVFTLCFPPPHARFTGNNQHAADRCSSRNTDQRARARRSA